jgi:8-oxo-dGTP pyrophosphatase MutT (NUDIX family)
VEQLSSRVAYQNAWMTVREDVVRRSDGSTGLYGVVDKTDFALVLPREDDGFWLVEQYRYPIGRRAWEFPQGGWSGAPQGDAAALARTELIEETGLATNNLQHLGHLQAAYGFCSQGFDVFLATDLTHGEHAREATEQDMISGHFADREILGMITTGAIVDGSSLAALALYQLHVTQRLSAG